MMVSLQGNVNREEPSMYVIRDEMVEGSPLNGAKFWFDTLDETYTGQEAFTKKPFTDPYLMLKDNKNLIKGAVLYNERIVDASSVSGKDYKTRYADMAVLNLTVMMCGQYEAVALTYEQYNTLKDSYGVTLPVLGDTALFMKHEENGTLSDSKGDRNVWMDVTFREGKANIIL